MGHIRIKISQKQAKEMLSQFEKDPEFNVHKSNDSEYYTIIPRRGGAVIHIYKFDKKWYLEIFS